jgi:hypothetical protein
MQFTYTDKWNWCYYTAHRRVRVPATLEQLGSHLLSKNVNIKINYNLPQYCKHSVQKTYYSVFNSN